MNTFYYFENNIYEKLEDVQFAMKNYTCKKYDEIKTLKDFDEFENEYDNLRKEGNSALDAIEWAK